MSELVWVLYEPGELNLKLENQLLWNKRERCNNKHSKIPDRIEFKYKNPMWKFPAFWYKTKWNWGLTQWPSGTLTTKPSLLVSNNLLKHQRSNQPSSSTAVTEIILFWFKFHFRSSNPYLATDPIFLSHCFFYPELLQLSERSNLIYKREKEHTWACFFKLNCKYIKQHKPVHSIQPIRWKNQTMQRAKQTGSHIIGDVILIKLHI